MPQKLDAKGSQRTKVWWDDGSDHDDVTKITLRGGVHQDGTWARGIRSICFDYVKNGKLKIGPFHGKLDYGYTQTFEINHKENEYLESVDGYYDEIYGIQALQFKTNFRTSELIGSSKKCSKFTLAVTGKKIIGFHGNVEILSLGAYFTWVTPKKLEAKGGKGGRLWDDGYDHDNISKIYVRGGYDGIQFIKFDYVKNGQVKNGLIHGVSSTGFTQTFDINQLNEEYLISIEGYYDDVTGVIQGIQFKTNLQIFDMVGYDKGRKFSLEASGNKIIGFHGYAEKNINSIGAYFTTNTPNKLEMQGALDQGGFLWDDGANHDGIRKVFGGDWIHMDYLGFDYDNGGKVEKLYRRGYAGSEKEFVVDYPNEFITSVEGIVALVSTGPSGSMYRITSLTFTTSKGRTFFFGSKNNNPTYEYKFVLEKKGYALVGFHGKSTPYTLEALGAYYSPLPPPPDKNKLEAKGGNGGDSWDDGVFDGIRRIYIGLRQNDVVFVKFMYYKDTKFYFGDDHGDKTQIHIQEFELNYPNDYLSSVEGSYDTTSGVIIWLKLTLNNQPNLAVEFGRGTTTSSNFILQKTDHKIVGFHGRSGNMLHQMGVHVIPI